MEEKEERGQGIIPARFFRRKKLKVYVVIDPLIIL